MYRYILVVVHFAEKFVRDNLALLACYDHHQWPISFSAQKNNTPMVLDL